MSESTNITQLLVAWSDGDQSALERLAPLVEHELRRIAAYHMAGERPDNVLQPTALVNEAVLRLMNWKNVHWQNRCTLFRHGRAVDAQGARRCRHASRGRAKRGGREVHITLSEATDVPSSRARRRLSRRSTTR
jgi:hypothetical protein